MTAQEFLLSGWDWKPSVIAGCAGMLLAYGAAVRWRFSLRAAAWCAGVSLILLASISPIDALADSYLFSVHMAKHIVFLLVVPALLLLGFPAEFAARWGRFHRFSPHPAVCWLTGIGTMAFWHIPTVFDAALAHRALHIAEHVSLLAAGTVYWWPILAPTPRARLNPVPQAAAYLFTSCLACTTMGVLITFAPALLYAPYAHPADTFGMLATIRQNWGISAMLDQQIGGLLMWVPCCLIYLTAIMAMFGRWYGEPAEAPQQA